MQPQSLFDHSARQVRDTSLEAWREILPTLSEREFEVLSALYRYIAETGHKDATGGEIASFAGLSILSVRPRVNGLKAKGLVSENRARMSRVSGERKAHPVSPVLSWAAVARAKEQR